jgi:probable phosphoglycerate mutase
MHGKSNPHSLDSYVSPRNRAQRTLELLNLGRRDEHHLWQQPDASTSKSSTRMTAEIQVTEDIREWDYGDYEGLTTAQINERRKQEGIEGKFNIWVDGCPGGE